MSSPAAPNARPGTAGPGSPETGAVAPWKALMRRIVDARFGDDSMSSPAAATLGHGRAMIE